MDATGVWDLVPVKPSHGERSRWQRHHSESSSPAPRGFNPLAARGSLLARNDMRIAELDRKRRKQDRGTIYYWELDGVKTCAWTKSQARANFKNWLAVDRLPAGKSPILIDDSEML